MKIADAVVQRKYEDVASQTRTVIHTFARVVPIDVSSVAIEASFIPLAQEIPLDLAHESVVNILPVQSDMFLFKGAQQTNLTPAKGFEFTQRKFSVVAVVELPDGTIGSRDPFRQSEPYGQQVALVPLWGETEVPTGAKVVGAVELAGFAISAQDRETGQEYKLGYLPCERDFQGA